jgi:murein DD-endopeptidase MepM/ murein hydrolase activator NlpD
VHVPTTARVTETPGANQRSFIAGVRSVLLAWRLRGDRARRLAGAIGVVTVVAVLGSACGRYPYPQASRQQAQTPVSVSSPVADSASADPSVVGDDGNDPAGKATVTGGSSSVDLSKIFGTGRGGGKGGTGRASPGSRMGSGNHSTGHDSGGQSSGGTKGGSTGGSSDGGTLGGSKGTGSSDGAKNGATGSSKGGTSAGSGKGPAQSGIRGDDGADPGKPAIKGSFQGPLPSGDMGLAELVSRETTQGAKYNSTVLPAGFPFLICPVQPGKGEVYSYSDGYGAPRYAGGYHPHAGVDIFANEGTPIVAPFDGYAERVPNTLGGNAVEVHGAQGYVYMAHLVAYGITDRNVQAGTVVGFVGNTGDAQGTAFHDHFEWHPNQVASYDRVIAGTNGAVDPFPYLQVVCPPD